ncbi:MAG: hypothetical protein L0H93_23010, partial [Nocardioides sp.]|nr:hypothetical protein [Nocardioides sp.]
MGKLKILPVLIVSAVLLAGCGDQEGNFEGAVMGDPAAGADAATDDPSGDASEDPSGDASEDPSGDASEDP